MKAFIFVALVASVAARSFDVNTLRLLQEQKSLLNRPLVNDVLLKDQLINRVPLEKTTVGDIDSTIYPVDQTIDTVRGIYDQDRVLTFEELYQTTLFRQYLQIPLFRQYIQYPSFQRYVASVYFQRFYQIPAFRQYFLNPVLFYKYIYPIVQLFASEYTVPSTTGIYGQYDDVLGLQNVVDDVIYRNKNVLPYVYNYNNLPYGYTTSRIGQQYLPYTTATTNYKFLLDRLYKNLFVNQPTVGDVTEVKTDVKVLPGDRKVVVEPITGEQKVVVQDPKIVDVKVDSKVVPVENVQVPVVDTVTVPTTIDRQVEVVDEVVLKQLLKYNIITPAVYRQILSGNIDLYQYLLQQRIITSEIYQLLVLNKVDIYTVLRQVLGIDIVRSDVDITVPTTFDRQVDVVVLKQLLKYNIITPVVYEQILLGKIDLYQYLLQQRIITSEIYQLLVLNKVDIYTVLRQVLGIDIFRSDVVRDVDSIIDFPVNRFDRTNLVNKLYNQELPTLRRDTLFNRLPLQNVLRDIVA